VKEMGKGTAMFTGCIALFCALSIPIFINRGEMTWVGIEIVFVVIMLLLTMINLTEDKEE
jgi:hypothetical protein